jgi:MraZ protein
MAFRGNFEYSLDDKNRLTVPAKLRDRLSDGVVLARGMDPCVEVWPAPDFDARMHASLQGLHPMSTEARTIKAFYGGNSFEGKLDGAGRVAVAPSLMDYAGLEKEVVVVGAEDCLQIWNRGAWKVFNDRLASGMNEIADRLGHAPA